MYEYFVQDRKILQLLGSLGEASKVLSTILPTAQTLKYFDIFCMRLIWETPAK